MNELNNEMGKIKDWESTKVSSKQKHLENLAFSV